MDCSQSKLTSTQNTLNEGTCQESMSTVCEATNKILSDSSNSQFNENYKSLHEMRVETSASYESMQKNTLLDHDSPERMQAPPPPENKREPVEKVIKRPLTGYVIGRLPIQKVSGYDIYLHPLTKLYVKRKGLKSLMFEQLIPMMMKELNISQTTALGALASSAEFTPYLRKITATTMQSIGYDPLKLQKTLLLELVTRMQQGFKLYELIVFVRTLEPDTFCLEIDDNIGETKSLIISGKYFHELELGDETFREMGDRIKGYNTAKNKMAFMEKLLNNLAKRKEKSMVHWQDTYAKILSTQNYLTKKEISCMTSGIHEQYGRLIPTTDTECNDIIKFLSELDLVHVHSGFTIMKLVYPWLSSKFFDEEKYSSEKLNILKSAACNMLYYRLESVQRLSHIIRKPSNFVFDSSVTKFYLDKIKDCINIGEDNNLICTVDFISKILFALVKAKSEKQQLAIAYTIEKFNSNDIFVQLTELSSFGDIYRALLRMTLPINHKNVDETNMRQSIKNKINCTFESTILKIALTITLVAKETNLRVDSKTLDLAKSILTKKTAATKKHESESIVIQNRMDCFISDETYLNIKVDDAKVSCALDSLLVPRDKHFRLINPQSVWQVYEGGANVDWGRLKGDRERRLRRCARDDEKLLYDFLFLSRNVDMTQPLNFSLMEIPATYLFPGENSICIRYPNIVCHLKNTRIHAGELKRVNRDQILNLIQELFFLASNVTKCKMNIHKEIEKIKSNQEKKKTLNIALFIGELNQSLKLLRSNSMRKQLIQYFCFLLFYELSPQENSNSIHFKKLLQFLYVMHSNADKLGLEDDALEYNCFSYSRTLKLKIEINEYIAPAWFQPDGLHGKRIKEALIMAFNESFQDRTYENIIDHLLEKIRPDGLDATIHKATLITVMGRIEALLYDRYHLEKMASEKNIRRSSCMLESTTHLGNEVVEFIEDAATICDKISDDFESTESGIESMQTSPAPMKCNSSEDLTTTTVSEFNMLVNNYLGEQCRSLVSKIGVWCNVLRSGKQFMTQGDITKINIKILKMINFLEKKTDRQSREKKPIENATIAKEIITLHDDFAKVQDQYANWISTEQIFDRHNQYIEISNTVENLNDCIPYHFDPVILQIKINTHIGNTSAELSDEDHELMHIMESLIKGHSNIDLLFSTLNHPNIKYLSNNPEEVTARIHCAYKQHDTMTRERHDLYLSLKGHLSTNIINNKSDNFSDAKQRELKKIREKHQRFMYSLTDRQRKCRQHILWRRSVLTDNSLHSILQNMKWKHDIPEIPFDTQELKDKQKQQLATSIMSIPCSDVVSSMNTSLFDIIGIKKYKDRDSKKQDKKENKEKKKHIHVDRIGSKRFMEIDRDNLPFKYLSKIEALNKIRMNAENKDLDEIRSTVEINNLSHKRKAKEIAKLDQRLMNLLGPKQKALIHIVDKDYSYQDALIAYLEVSNGDGAWKRLSRSLTPQQETLRIIICDLTHQNKASRLLYEKNKKWRDLASQCQHKKVDPNTLPLINRMMDLESFSFDSDIEEKITKIKLDIDLSSQEYKENLLKIKQAAEEIENTLKVESEPQLHETKEMEQDLFVKAFECSQNLPLNSLVQSLLCSYTRKGHNSELVKENILNDYNNLIRHVPTQHIVESPYRWDATQYKTSNNFLIFAFVNVKGAYPLLKTLYAQRKNLVSPYTILAYDKEGEPIANALMLAAAMKRYRACETLMNILNEHYLGMNIDTLKELLTVNPSPDRGNLLHHVANCGQLSTMDTLLKLTSNISGKQSYDSDYTLEENLANQVVMDKNLILKELLIQQNADNMLPTDVFLFRIGEGIKKWDEGKMKNLRGFYNEFLINDLKLMWSVVAETLDANQQYNTMEWFMKGVCDFDDLIPRKREEAIYFLRQLVRIFRVHSPQNIHDDLMNYLSSMSID